MSGIESVGNSTSTTGPVTRARRPVSAAESSEPFSSSTVVVILSLTPSFTGGVRIGEGVHATDDLADFLGDPGLAGLVGNSGVLLDQLFGVVGCRLHRLLTR